MTDLDKVTVKLNSVLSSNINPFRSNLAELCQSAGVSNTPRRRYFSLVSDALTITSLIKNVGEWCVAEIEGVDIQFNPVVSK